MINNPALVEASRPFVYPENLQYPSGFSSLASLLSAYIKDESRNGKSLEDEDIFTLLTKPSRIYPNSLTDQIKYIIREWAYLLPKDLIELLQLSISYIKEEEKDRGIPGPPGPMPVTDYSDELYEYEAFSDDSNWMPRVVMIAKCTLVWLDQLSKEYKCEITRLDQIPDRELDLLRERGFTALWLIGLWERSSASKRIKNLCGNPDAEASAYSLKDYDISVHLRICESVAARGESVLHPIWFQTIPVLMETGSMNILTTISVRTGHLSRHIPITVQISHPILISK